jgi:hypothetical protein
MSAAYTHKLSVQVLDFEDIGLLIQLARLICDFCSSDQRFACGFLQIPPRDGHPCRPANDSPCRVRRRLSLPSGCALPGAPKENPLPFGAWQRVPKEVLVMSFFAILASESQPPTRCLYANDGWHDDVRRGDAAFC